VEQFLLSFIRFYSVLFEDKDFFANPTTQAETKPNVNMYD